MANNTQLYRLQVQLKRIAAHREANAEAEVKAIYNRVLQELQNKIASYYAAYGDNDGILTGGELRKIGEYKNFLEDVLSGLDDLGEPVQQQIRQTIEQTYTACYDGMVAAVQQSTAKDSELSETLSGLEGTTPEAVRQVVENPMTNLKLSTVLNRQRSQVTTSIKKTLTTGLASGDSYTKMAHRIAKTLNGNYTKAQRIVRTECNRAIHKGFQDVTDRAADLLDGTDWVEVKTWLSKSDERVRETHAYLDGQMVHTEGEFTSNSGAKAQYPGGFGIASEDINCRCTVKYTLMKKDEFLAQGGVLPESEKGLTESADDGIIKMGKVKGYVQNPPDFSKYTIEDNPEEVEAAKQTLFSEFGLSKKDVDLTGVQNTSVLKPFVQQLAKIHEQTGFQLPNIKAVEVIDGDSCCIAGFKPMEGRFYISSKFFNSKEATTDTMKEWAANGLLPKQAKTIQYLAEHESAHMRIPDEVLNTKKADSLHSKYRNSKNLGYYDADIYEFFADCLAIYRMNRSTTDMTILNTIEYLKEAGIS